jgi:hypothetical protein
VHTGAAKGKGHARQVDRLIWGEHVNYNFHFL